MTGAPETSPPYDIDELIIEPAAADSPTAGRLLRWARAQGILVRHAAADGRAGPDRGADPSKRAVRLVRHEGQVVKACTGRTDSLLCCNLQVIAQTVGCPLDCSYCILQDYHNRAQIVVQTDPGRLLERAGRDLARQPRRLQRVCTGQVADSLALEPLVGFAAEAVSCFAGLNNAVLELKTKTDRVGFLLDLPHGGRTILSWSLNPAEVVAAEEHRAAPLAARLAAAGRAVQAGYLVAFHLDPMIAVDAAPGSYLELLRQALAAVPAQRLAYVSLGTVRFLPAMRRTVLARFPGSRVTLGELLPEVDGKLRLLAPLRIALYRALADELRRLAPEVFLYLCMEPPRVWRRALDRVYADRGQLDCALSESLHRRFGLAPVSPRREDYPP